MPVLSKLGFKNKNVTSGLPLHRKNVSSFMGSYLSYAIAIMSKGKNIKKLGNEMDYI
jgi:hypothetical protein